MGHGPVGVDFPGQVPENREAVQSFQSDGLCQTHKKCCYIMNVWGCCLDPRQETLGEKVAVFTFSLCNRAWQIMSSQMEADGAKQWSR